MGYWSVVCFLIFGVFLITDGAKILFYIPSISASHVIMNGKLADVLVEAGHDVVLFIPEYDKTITTNGTKLAKVWRMTNISDVFMNGFEEIGDALFNSVSGTYEERIIFEDAIGIMCEAIMDRRKELDIIKDYGFDVVITEMYDLCGVGITRFLGIKNHIWYSTTPLHDNFAYNMGVPAPVSYVPTTEENLLGPVMSFIDRAYNMLMYLVTLKSHHHGSDRSNDAIRKYAGPDFPCVRELAAESTIAFVNNDEFLEPARPILHKTIYIGGIGIREPKPLEEPFASFIQKAKKGVVLFSLGTFAPTRIIKYSLKKEIVELFSEFEDYQFIVKVDATDEAFFKLAENVKNVKVTSSSQIKLFITHGGMNSLLETATRGVPVVVIPFYTDQFRNSKTAEYRGFGVVVQKIHLNRETLGAAMKQVLENDRYKEAALRVSHLMRTKPFKPEEVFLRWTEFVAENGVLPELIPEGAKLSFIQYFCLDVIFVFFSVPLVLVYITIYLIRRIYRATLKIKRE